MVAAWLESGLPWQLRVVDIAGSDKLFERYGLRIPVLQRDDGEELNWPFEMEELGRFLESGGP